MTTWGYTLSSEEFAPADLVRYAALAEDAGFDFLTVSDHYHPWVSSQGHSPFVWTTLGGVGARTTTIEVGTGVTCPIIRMHPAIVAQAAATSASIMEGPRFFLGVGTGEWLNEHILGDRWPSIETRVDMLVEAISVMRALWTGETVDHHGEHFTVENAKLFTTADYDIPVIWAASGPKSAHRAGPELDPIAALVQKYTDAGFDHVHFHQVGSDQRSFLDAWTNKLLPAL